MDITVDTLRDTATVDHVQIRSRFVGLCDYYFNNDDVARQANEVPSSTASSLNVVVLGGGQQVANIPIALQCAGCDEGSIRESMQVVNTGTGQHQGSAEFKFELRNSDTFCRCRVVAPFGSTKAHQSYYPIDTFTEQKYFD